MQKFKSIKKKRMVYGDIQDGRDYCEVTFEVSPFKTEPGIKWQASIYCEITFDDLSFLTISSSFIDFDVLFAMEKAQRTLFETQTLTDKTLNTTDDLWNDIVIELEKQFGFPLA